MFRAVHIYSQILLKQITQPIYQSWFKNACILPSLGVAISKEDARHVTIFLLFQFCRRTDNSECLNFMSFKGSLPLNCTCYRCKHTTLPCATVAPCLMTDVNLFALNSVFVSLRQTKLIKSTLRWKAFFAPSANETGAPQLPAKLSLAVPSVGTGLLRPTLNPMDLATCSRIIPAPYVPWIASLITLAIRHSEVKQYRTTNYKYIRHLRRYYFHHKSVTKDT